MKDFKTIQHWGLKWIPLFLILTGIILRLVVYLQNRSLFMDEANLARNYALKSFSQLWQPLDYEQYAPPLFNSIEYLLISVWGLHEYALRFFPLLCGIAILILFYALAKRFIDQTWLWFPIALLAFSPNFLRYATEVKQYSTDAAVTLAILLLALNRPPEKFQKKDIILWSFLGMAGVWLSMPIVFVLAGVGLYYLFHFYTHKNKLVLWILLPITLWLVSFAVYFFSILQADAGTDYLQGYHKNYFFPLIPTSTTDLYFFKEIIFSFFRTSMGHTTLAIGWGIVSFSVGVYHLYKKSPAQAGLLLIPVFSCLVASYLSYYSLYPRLTLFFIPIFLLFIGIGTAQLLQAAHSYLKPLLVLLLLIILFNKQALRHFTQPLYIDEIKPVMQYLKEHRKEGESVYIHHKAVPAFTFYNQYYQHQYNINSPRLANRDEAPRLNKTGPCWFVFSFYSEEEAEQELAPLKKKGKLLDEFSIEGSACYLFSGQAK